MTNICLYFQVHQPFRMRKYNVFDIGHNSAYFDDKKNREVMQKVAKKCYLPANRVLRSLIAKHPGFKVAFSITGTAIEQFQQYAPAVLDSFEELASTGAVEFLSETYYHSLSFLHDKQEFAEQVRMHQKLIKERFGQKPTVFRNTELVFNNALAKTVEEMGYTAVLAEGADHILGTKSPNFVYSPKNAKHMRLLLKNYRLSDDIAFRFSDKNWSGYPVTAKKYADWLAPILGDSINLFMDYETFGEHQWEDTGIFTFLSQLPAELKKKGISFRWPSELAKLEPRGELDIHNPVSWADVERDTSAWLGNRMQNAAAERLYALRKDVLASRDPAMIEAWRRLSTSDHFYYMCTKWFNDGDVHKYFNPYDSPYEAFIAYMNILNDLILRVKSDERGGVGAALKRWMSVS
jgi:alpha-amylase